MFPGNYNIYCYGLTDKTTSSKKVYSLKMLKNISIFNKKEFIIIPDILSPSVEINKSDEGYKIFIIMNDLYDVMSLSSFSIKQGDAKLKSYDFSYSSEDKQYSIVVPDIQGDWSANISYSIKSRIDSDLLKNDGISISTSYFSNIFLGTY